MSEPSTETTGARLGPHPAHAGYPLSHPLAPPRSVDWSAARGNGWGYRGDSRDSRIYNRRPSVVVQMSYRDRLKRESQLIYQELLKTPPVVLFILSCLAVLLVGAILVGATR